MVRRTHVRYRLTARRAIARDTLTILAGALLAVIIGNLAGVGAPVSDPSSPTPDDSSTIIGGGSLAPHATFPPIETLGPIVNPSTGFDATPTPIPIITLGPSPSPSPSASPRPSIKPSPKPTTRASPTPSPTPVPTPTPAPPVAAFTCTTLPSLVVSFTNQSTGDMSSWLWDFGDLSGSSTAQNPTDYAYALAGDYTVVLQVAGSGGTDTISHTCKAAP